MIDQTIRQTTRIPTSAGRGYYTSTLPPGIHFGRDRKRESAGEDANEFG